MKKHHEGCKDFCDKDFIALLGGLWGLWLLVMFAQIAAASMDRSNCKKPLARIEYVVPGYYVGCWILERPGE